MGNGLNKGIFTKDELDSLYFYKQDGYKPINSFLYYGKVNSDYKKKDLEKIIDILQNLILKKGEISKGKIVYRGMKETMYEDGIIKTFISTSQNIKISEFFMNTFKKKPCCLHRIYIAPGVKFYDFKDYLKNEYIYEKTFPKSEGYNPPPSYLEKDYEEEILLPHGLYIKNVKTNDDYYSPYSYKLPIHDVIIANKENIETVKFPDIGPPVFDIYDVNYWGDKYDNNTNYILKLLFDILQAINTNPEMKPITNVSEFHKVIKQIIPIKWSETKEYWKGLMKIKFVNLNPNAK